jgi:predicted transcriptional regulator
VPKKADHYISMRSISSVSVGAHIKKIRGSSGLSQREAARLADIRPEVLCRIEKGFGNPTIKTVSKILGAISK